MDTPSTHVRGAPSAHVTPGQAACLDLLAEGLQYKEIAACLGVSVETVKTQLQSAYRVLGVHRSFHAVRVWQTRGEG